MIDYGELEDDIVAKISSEITGLQANTMPLPETEAEFRRVTKTVIMVCYGTSKFSDPKRMGLLQQEEDIFLDVVIRSKKLRGESGIYHISRLLRGKLLGYRPDKCTEISFVENGRSMSEEDFKDGVWTHTLSVKCKAYAIQDEPEQILPKLQSATFLSTPNFTVTNP